MPISITSSLSSWLTGHPGLTERTLSITLETRDNQAGFDTARASPSFGGDWTLAATHGPSSNDYQPRLAEMVILWRVTNSGFTSWTNNTQNAALDAALGSTYWNTQTYSQEPMLVRCFAPNTTATIELFVYHPATGEWGQASTTKTTGTFASVWSGSQVLLINPSGDSDFSWSSSVYGEDLSSGAVQLTDNGSNIPGAITSRYGSPLLVLFKDGGTYTGCATTLTEANVASGLVLGRSGHIGTEGSKPLLRVGNNNNLITGSGWASGSTVKDITVFGLRMDGGTNAFNPTTDTPLTSNAENGFWSLGANVDALFHDCTLTGLSDTVFNIQAGTTLETHFHLNDMVIGPDLGGPYPILTAEYYNLGSSFALTGGRLLRSPDTDSTRSGSTEIGSVLRVNGFARSSYEAVDTFSTQRGGSPTWKLNEEQASGTVMGVSRCIVEASVSQPLTINRNSQGTSGYANTALVRGNLIIPGNGGSGLDAMLSFIEGLSFDRNLVVVPGLSGSNADGFSSTVHATIDTVNVSGVAPIRVRSNTTAVLRTSTENGGATPGNLSNDGYTDASENANLRYFPNLSSPVEDHSALTTTQILTLRAIGRQEGGTLLSGYAPDSTDVAAYQPTSAPSTASGDLWPLPLGKNLPGDILTSGMSIGAWQYEGA